MNDMIFTLSNGFLTAIFAMFLAAILGVFRTFLRGDNAAFSKNGKTVTPCNSTSYEKSIALTVSPPVQQHLKT